MHKLASEILGSKDNSHLLAERYENTRAVVDNRELWLSLKEELVTSNVLTNLGVGIMTDKFLQKHSEDIIEAKVRAKHMMWARAAKKTSLDFPAMRKNSMFVGSLIGAMSRKTHHLTLDRATTTASTATAEPSAGPPRSLPENAAERETAPHHRSQPSASSSQRTSKGTTESLLEFARAFGLEDEIMSKVDKNHPKPPHSSTPHPKPPPPPPPPTSTPLPPNPQKNIFDPADHRRKAAVEEELLGILQEATLVEMTSFDPHNSIQENDESSSVTYPSATTTTTATAKSDLSGTTRTSRDNDHSHLIGKMVAPSSSSSAPPPLPCISDDSFSSHHHHNDSHLLSSRHLGGSHAEQRRRLYHRIEEREQDASSESELLVGFSPPPEKTTREKSEGPELHSMTAKTA